MLSGNLEVNLKNGKNKKLYTGDTITEVVNTLHRGTNLSNTEPVVLPAFYAGAIDIPLTIYREKAEKGCKL